MLKKIPISLIYSRVLIGAVILWLALFQVKYFQGVIIGLVAFGLVADIADGIIARHLKISTPKLRRMDSNIDMFFWICVITASYIINPSFYRQNLVAIGLLIFLEAACYILCFIRFKKEVATHAWSAKAWTLTLFATLIFVIDCDAPIALFRICFYLGILSRLEIIAMLMVIKKWTNDIPTLITLLRSGKESPLSGTSCLTGNCPQTHFTHSLIIPPQQAT